MELNNDILAIVPARGGSKGIPRKNLRKIGGRSLVARAIDSLRNSEFRIEVIVSTDDPEIATEARSAGANVPFVRPDAISTDHATTVDVIVHALEFLRSNRGALPRWFVLAEPTNPFRTPETISAAINRALVGDVRSVVAVCQLERKPQFIFRKIDGRVERYIESPIESFSRRQDMTHICRLSNVVWVVDSAEFLATRSLLLAPTGYVESSRTESLNIDEPIDLSYAEFLVDRRQAV